MAVYLTLFNNILSNLELKRFVHLDKIHLQLCNNWFATEVIFQAELPNVTLF